MNNSLITFDEMLDRVRAEKYPVCSERLVFMHIAKTGGIWFQSILKGEFRTSTRYDGPPADFQPMLNQTYSNIHGHFTLADPLFLDATPKLLSTILRDPVERMISNYRFTWVEPIAPFHNEVRSRGMDVIQYTRESVRVLGYQYSYFNKSNNSIFADPEQCFVNLSDTVGLLGMTHALEDLIIMFAIFYGAERIFVPFAHNTTNEKFGGEGVNAPVPSESQRHSLTEILEDDVKFFQMAEVLYKQRQQAFIEVIGRNKFIEAKKTLRDIIKKQGTFLMSLSPQFSKRPSSLT